MLRKVTVGSVLTLCAIGLLALIAWTSYYRGKAAGSLYSFEHLGVLRAFLPAFTERAADKQSLQGELTSALDMQERYAIDEFLALPALARLGLHTTQFGEETLADKIAQYQQWLRSSATRESGSVGDRVAGSDLETRH